MVKWIPNLPEFGEETCKKVARIATLAEGAKQLEVEMKADEPVRVGDILMGDYREENGKLYHSTPWWVERVEYKWPENICKVNAREVRTDGKYMSTYRMYDKIVKYMRYRGLICEFWPILSWPTWRHDPQRTNSNLGADTLVIPEVNRLVAVHLRESRVFDIRIPTHNGDLHADEYNGLWLRQSKSTYFRISEDIQFFDICSYLPPAEDCDIVISHLFDTKGVFFCGQFWHGFLFFHGCQVDFMTGEYKIWPTTGEWPQSPGKGQHRFCGPDTNTQTHYLYVYFPPHSEFVYLRAQKFNENLEPIGEPVELDSLYVGSGIWVYYPGPSFFIQSDEDLVGFIKWGSKIVRWSLGNKDEPPSPMDPGVYDVGLYLKYYTYHPLEGSINGGVIFQSDDPEDPENYLSINYYRFDMDEHIQIDRYPKGVPSWEEPNSAKTTICAPYIAIFGYPTNQKLIRIINIEALDDINWQVSYPIRSAHWISNKELVLLCESGNKWYIQIYDLDGSLITSTSTRKKSNLAGNTIVV